MMKTNTRSSTERRQKLCTYDRAIICGKKTVKALEENNKQTNFVVKPSDSSEDQPTEDTTFKTGVLANVLQLLKLPDGTVKTVEGQTRVLITALKISPFRQQNDEIEETLGDEKQHRISQDRLPRI